MGRVKQVWNRIWGEFVHPQVSDEDLDACYQQAREQLPTPVFWLLGKTQSGKTSLIRALTQNTRAEIGNGIRPCTRTARMYPFPSEEDCLLRFLDTRGLGEVHYDPEEDLNLFQGEAHLLIVVLKALDHAQQGVMTAVERIHRARPQWPVLVVQTTLHEGYPTPEFQHPQPYPFSTLPYPLSLPSDLTRSLAVQREMFEQAQVPARFIPVDFTQPEDGYEPVNYGLDAFWQAIEEALPLGLRGMLQGQPRFRKELRGVHWMTAQPHILSYAVAAGGAGLVPIPLVDIPLVLGIQAKMFHAIASIYHQEFDRQQIGEILGTLGLGYLARLGGRELLKLIPGWGSAVVGLYSGASTYALGLTLCAYFSHAKEGTIPEPAEFRKIYDTYFQEGRDRLRDYLKAL